MKWYEYYTDVVIKKFFCFEGRARRKEFWMFILCNAIVAAILGALDSVIGVKIANSIGILVLIYDLAILLPSLGVCVRRLHDIGKSGWWVLISLIPLVGAIWLIVLFCKEGVKGDNEYGPDPKAAE